MPDFVVTAPSAEPLDVLAVKTHLRVTDTGQDSLLSGWISAARAGAQQETQRQLVHARVTQVLDAFPMAGVGTPLPFANPVNIPPFAIILLRAPLVRVVSITYLDMSGTLQTMLTTDYAANAALAPAIITPAFGKVWPIALPQVGAISVTYDCGYASPMTANPATDQITVRGPVTWNVNDIVRFQNSGGALPLGLSPLTDYYIKTAPGAGVYTLSATLGGTLLDLTDAGTGTQFIGEMPPAMLSWMLMRLGSFYENREDSFVVERGNIDTPAFVDGLLDPYRIVLP